MSTSQLPWRNVRGYDEECNLWIAARDQPQCRPSFDLHRQLCLQQFSILYRHHVEHCHNPRHKKNFLVAKDLKIIAPESCCFWYWCWFVESAILHLTSGKMSTTKWRWLKRPYGFCNRCKCGGILGNSCSSLISGTCGSQLSVLVLWWSQYGVLLIFSLLGVMSFARYFATDWAFCWRFLSSS